MATNNDWLSDVLREVREDVSQWPDWKRSDEVRRELRKLGSEQQEKTVQAPSQTTEKVRKA